MTTTSDLIEETKALLFSGEEPEYNRLDGDIDSTVASITFKYPLHSITRGAVISVGLEDIRIWDTSGFTATVVERHVNGTTAASHSDLDLVSVRPRFSDFRILRALNEELSDLSSPVNGLYQVKTVELTYNATRQAYDLTGVTNLSNILELRYKLPGSSHQWPLIGNGKYDILRNMNTSEFASGFALTLYEEAYPGQTIRVRYGADFTSLSTLTDDVTTVSGLPASAVDIPPLGAAIRLVSAREIARNFLESQPEPRRSEEVPAGAVMQSVNGLRALRQQRIIAEAAKLQSDWTHA